MSGSIMQFNPVQPVDPIAGQTRLANLGLIGQQLQGAEMTNQLRRAQLNLQLPMLQDMSGSGGAIGGGGSGGGGGGGSQGGVGLTTGSQGTVISGVGAVPRMLATSIFSGSPETWSAGISKLLTDKKTLVGQMVAGTIGADGHADPIAWNQMVDQAYHGGWMTNVDRARFLNHPELAPTVLGSLAPVEQQPWFKGRQTEAETQARNRGTPYKINVPLPGGGTQEMTVPTSDVLSGGIPSGMYNEPGRGNQIAPKFDPATGQPLSYSNAPPQMPAGARPGGVGGPPLPPWVTPEGTNPPPAPGAPGGANAPPLPGVASGPPTPTKVEEERIADDRARITEDSKALESIQQGAQHLTQAMPQIYNARRLVPDAITGSLAPERAAIANFMQTFGGEWAQRATNALAGIDPAKTGATQELVKQTFGMVTAAESQLAGARIGAMLTNYFSKAMPNISMQGPAMKDMMNFILTGMQMVRDYSQAAQVHADTSRDTFIANPVQNRYQRLSKFESAWQDAKSVHAPTVYEAASLLLNGKAPADAFRGLSNDQKVEAVHVAGRVDPEWTPSGYTRK